MVTMIVYGLLLGRWWRFTLITAAAIWPTYLLVTGETNATGPLLLAAAWGALTAAVGVAVHQGILWLFRRSGRGERKTRQNASR